MNAYGKAIEALGDPTRRGVFERLGQRPMAVGELAAGMPVSRPAVSQHLKVLLQAGLVTERREGTRRIYGISPDGLAEVRAYFDRFWNQALASFKEAAETKGEQRMSAVSTIEPITTGVDVAVPPERAWEVFVGQMADWWPLRTHSIAAGEDKIPESVVVEQGIGGEIYEVFGRTRRHWARIHTWEPPSRLGYTWHVNPDRPATDVVITFEPIDGGTRVEVVHSGWEAYGEAAAAAVSSYGGAEGWPVVLGAFANAVT